VVPLDEQHAVAVVWVSPELQGFGQQSIKSPPEVDPVARQEHAADFHAQHGPASPTYTGYSVTRLMLTRHDPTRSSRPPSDDELAGDA
jgi:hypothetical protein